MLKRLMMMMMMNKKDLFKIVILNATLVILTFLLLLSALTYNHYWTLEGTETLYRALLLWSLTLLPLLLLHRRFTTLLLALLSGHALFGLYAALRIALLWLGGTRDVIFRNEFFTLRKLFTPTELDHLFTAHCQARQLSDLLPLRDLFVRLSGQSADQLYELLRQAEALRPAAHTLTYPWWQPFYEFFLTHSLTLAGTTLACVITLICTQGLIRDVQNLAHHVLNNDYLLHEFIIAYRALRLVGGSDPQRLQLAIGHVAAIQEHLEQIFRDYNIELSSDIGSAAPLQPLVTGR